MSYWVLLALLGGWTLRHNRLGNFNVHPQPKTSGVMMTSEPCRLIHHPTEIAHRWQGKSSWLDCKAGTLVESVQ